MRRPGLNGVRLAVRSVAAAAIVEVGLRTTRLETLARVLGIELDVTKPTTPLTRSAPCVAEQRATERALALLGRTERACLRRALVLGHLLRDQRPTLRLGVTKQGGIVVAHAWLEIDGAPVTDPPERLARFRPLRAP